MLDAIAYAAFLAGALTEGEPPPAPPPPAPPAMPAALAPASASPAEVPANVLNGQPTGPAVLTAPPSRGGKMVDVTLVGATGIRAMATEARGGDADVRTGTVSLSTRRLGYAYDRGLLVRVVNAAELGGGPRGVEGGLSFAPSGGYRFDVGATHGFFVRGGALGMVRGNPLVYQSLLEIPEAHAGYQYLHHETLVELSSRGGFALLGRSDTGDHATRHIDLSPDLGAMATVRAPHTLMLVAWSHFLPEKDHDRLGGGVDWLDGVLCATARKLAICTDVRVVAGQVNLPSGGATTSTVTEVGVSLGAAGQ